jgi:hypothetical protein
MIILQLNEKHSEALTKFEKLHFLVPLYFTFKVGQKFKFQLFYSYELVEYSVFSIQKVWLAIDPNANYIIRIGNHLLNHQEQEIFAKNNGCENVSDLFNSLFLKMENHCFYRKTIDLNIIHLTDLKYSEQW